MTGRTAALSATLDSAHRNGGLSEDRAELDHNTERHSYGTRSIVNTPPAAHVIKNVPATVE